MATPPLSAEPTESTEPKQLPALFQLGQPAITVRAAAALLARGIKPDDLLLRHLSGDWGSVDDEDRQSNFMALLRGGRLISAYPLGDGREVWVITEADRSQTTILLPEDY